MIPGWGCCAFASFLSSTLTPPQCRWMLRWASKEQSKARVLTMNISHSTVSSSCVHCCWTFQLHLRNCRLYFHSHWVNPSLVLHVRLSPLLINVRMPTKRDEFYSKSKLYWLLKVNIRKLERSFFMYRLITLNIRNITTQSCQRVENVRKDQWKADKKLR